MGEHIQWDRQWAEGQETIQEDEDGGVWKMEWKMYTGGNVRGKRSE